MFALVAFALAAAPMDRVAHARPLAEARLREAFAAAGVAYPPGEVFVRAFKFEGQLELWAGARGRALSLVRQYPFCAKSGELGPKRRAGDLQVPEGVYRVDRFNPNSSFHLSLGLDYPNASDRVSAGPAPGERGNGERGRASLGGDIFIHGGCATVGCIPIGDEAIEELYLVSLDARTGGQRRILVHVFPHRLDDAGVRRLSELAPAWMPFWRQLRPIYEAFERTRRPPRVGVDSKTGRYVLGT